MNGFNVFYHRRGLFELLIVDRFGLMLCIYMKSVLFINTPETKAVYDPSTLACVI